MEGYDYMNRGKGDSLKIYPQSQKKIKEKCLCSMSEETMEYTTEYYSKITNKKHILKE